MNNIKEIIIHLQDNFHVEYLPDHLDLTTVSLVDTLPGLPIIAGGLAMTGLPEESLVIIMSLSLAPLKSPYLDGALALLREAPYELTEAVTPLGTAEPVTTYLTEGYVVGDIPRVMAYLVDYLLELGICIDTDNNTELELAVLTKLSEINLPPTPEDSPSPDLSVFSRSLNSSTTSSPSPIVTPFELADSATPFELGDSATPFELGDSATPFELAESANLFELSVTPLGRVIEGIDLVPEPIAGLVEQVVPDIEEILSEVNRLASIEETAPSPSPSTTTEEHVTAGGLNVKEEGLNVKEEGLNVKEEGLNVKEQYLEKRTENDNARSVSLANKITKVGSYKERLDLKETVLNEEAEYLHKVNANVLARFAEQDETAEAQRLTTEALITREASADIIAEALNARASALSVSAEALITREAEVDIITEDQRLTSIKQDETAEAQRLTSIAHNTRAEEQNAIDLVQQEATVKIVNTQGELRDGIVAYNDRLDQIGAQNRAHIELAAERDALLAERDALLAERDALIAERDGLGEN